MGYGVAAGIAAALANPEGKVVVLAGDGGLQMSCNELAVVQQYAIKNLLFIVTNNALLGRVHYGCGGVGDDLVNPDFVALAQVVPCALPLCTAPSEGLRDTDVLRLFLEWSGPRNGGGARTQT